MITMLFISVFGPPSLDQPDPESATDSSFVITWQPPSEGGGAAAVKRYLIQWSGDSKDNQTFVSGDLATTTINSLTPNTNYSVTVAAENTNQSVGEVSSVAFGTTSNIFYYLAQMFITFLFAFSSEKYIVFRQIVF